MSGSNITSILNHPKHNTVYPPDVLLIKLVDTTPRFGRYRNLSHFVEPSADACKAIQSKTISSQKCKQKINIT
jgi:hypothetical protein